MRLFVEYSIAQKLKSVRSLSFGEFVCSMEKIEPELDPQSKTTFSKTLDEIYKKYIPLYMDHSSSNKEEMSKDLNNELGKLLSNIFKYDLKKIVENLYNTLISLTYQTNEAEETNERDYIEKESKSSYDNLKILMYRNKFKSGETSSEHRISYA